MVDEQENKTCQTCGDKMKFEPVDNTCWDCFVNSTMEEKMEEPEQLIDHIIYGDLAELTVEEIGRYMPVAKTDGFWRQASEQEKLKLRIAAVVCAFFDGNITREGNFIKENHESRRPTEEELQDSMDYIKEKNKELCNRLANEEKENDTKEHQK